MRPLLLAALFSSVAASAFAQAHDLTSPQPSTVSANHPNAAVTKTPVEVEAARITAYQRSLGLNVGATTPVASPDTRPHRQASSTQFPSAQAPLAPNGLQPMSLYTARAGGGVHTVIKQDTLYNISKRYGVTVEAIKHANQLPGSRIQLGQKLIIPVQKQAALTTSSSVVTVTEPVAATPNRDTQLALDPGQGRIMAYAVASGDTLAAISRRTCVPEARLISENALINPDALSPGHMLTLPTDHCLAQ